MNNIICIAGPTASGKTALAVELAKELNGEVVSCDSMQVYKRMDIGTAKPTIEERQGIVHHMLDVAEPWEDFSVSRYCEMATPIVEDILAHRPAHLPRFDFMAGKSVETRELAPDSFDILLFEGIQGLYRLDVGNYS